jgi:hypothetical protein
LKKRRKDKMMEWYTIVSCGMNPAPARGPFKTLAEAREAVERFSERYGSEAGTYLAAGSVTIVGPFRTRKDAKEADISDYPEYGATAWD